MIDAIELSYSEFKAIVQSKKIRPQHIVNGNQYVLFAYDWPVKYISSIWIDPSVVPGVNAQQEADNKADFLETLAPVSNRALLTSPVAALSKFHGRKIEMAAEDTLSYCEWSFDHDVEINKVLPRPISAQFGDYVTMEVWARPGVMGAEAVKVEDFGSGIYLSGGDGTHGQWYQGSGGGKVPSYCTVRCYYHKTAGSARNFIIDAEFFE